MNYPQEKIKPYNADEKKSVQVEKMFDNIAPAYDQLNHALSWNIDKSWRRKAINWQIGRASCRERVFRAV